MEMRQRDYGARVLIGAMLVVGIPATLTLMSIKVPREQMAIPADPLLNPSPYGYTWSLLLFALPMAVLGWWVLSMHRGKAEKKAFWVSVSVLIPLWCALDVFLGLTFFTFPNTGASIGHFWGYSFDNGWQKLIPLEELGFYSFGFVAILLVYIWADEYWHAAYRKQTSYAPAKLRELISFHPQSAIFGVVLFAGAWLYKAYGPHAYHAGFPGYFLFMLLATILPSILFYRIASPFINWRALMMAMTFVVLLSLFWEGAVAIPYQWWGYKPEQMMGIFIGGLTNMPIEEAILWTCAAWTNVIVYTTIHTFLQLNRKEIGDVLMMRNPPGQ